ncbi:hypothetical protein AB205_0206660 [Aquarana catesbeiana]|uniref:Uncharacterized protein n=1 Tax=Aquarana catesbeiana TaxID=8400 RepID=A0A2G9R869_AQUCT|nr:hypothetical protein AB205_0206660 [Aquarana catesbeiana]
MLVTPWLAQEVASFWLLCVKGFSDDQSHISLCSHSSSAWQSVERDLRNQVSGGDRGFVEEYVEKQPSNNLKCGTSDLSGCCPGRLSRNTVTAFKPVDLNDLKRRSTQDPKKS